MTMLTPDEALYALLCKYLLNEADSNEQQWVNDWVQANPEHRVLLASLDKLVRTVPEQVVQGAMDTEMAWRLLSGRILERDVTFGELGALGNKAGKGDNKAGKGDDVTRKGDSVMGKGNDLIGKMNDVTGKGDNKAGKGDDVTRKEDDVKGEGNDVIGQREDVTGKVEVGIRKGDDLIGKMNDVTWKGEDMIQEEPVNFDNTQPKSPIKLYTRWLAAASILLLIGAGTWYLTHQNERQINYNGAQLVKLDDGTSIQLDPAAELQVLPGFGKKNRKVILKGKAEFDVTTDAAHPFIIDLGNQAITVLGTRFSVDNSQQLRVFINSGKIKVTRQQDSVILTAGMLLEEDTSRQHYKVGAHITDAVTRAVVFKDTPLREVLQTINVLYHVNVTADAELLDLPVTAIYTGEPVQNVLEAIAYLSNANVINNGVDYELRKQE